MRLLIAGSPDEIVTPEEIQFAVSDLLEAHPSLPEFVTSVFVQEEDGMNKTIRVCAQVYAKRYRLPYWLVEEAVEADALLYFGEKDEYGTIWTFNNKNKPWALRGTKLPELGVMTGIDADGVRRPLNLAEQEALDAELVK